MISCCYITKENIEKLNTNWPWILDHPYTVLIIGDSVSWKTNLILNLLKQQNGDDFNIIDKIYLYICMFSIQMKENINILLKNMKKLVWKGMKIKSSLLNIQIICRMSIKKLISTTQTENVKWLQRDLNPQPLSS